jgi:hypothetical protein
MFDNSSRGATRIGRLFGWPKKKSAKAIEPNGSTVIPHTNTNRVVCFRIDRDLDRRISRALAGKPWTRSDFIRNAIERVLKQDAEERLRAAHSAIQWE